ncbi:hypothetical protein [Chitinimonas lacunae]|uniref:Type II toxin-antitoxin system prevent-host-death family antitoxin n=1 Tax=Chitinimonas lacunae TaxID=1963018 RepID=A0ABV8MW21_9NEIS
MSDLLDLGYCYRTTRAGEVHISHHGRPAAILRGEAARRFLERVDEDKANTQLLMARITGNFRRGNESRAARHPRNGG